MVVHVVIPLKQDDEGAAEISKRLSEKSVEMVKLYQDNYKYTYFVAYDGSASELSEELALLDEKIEAAVIPVFHIAGYGPTSLKDWIRKYDRQG